MAGVRLVRNGALNRTGNGTTAVGGGLPRYAFVAHPGCCGLCNDMDSKLTGRLYSVADTWRITHPNCTCMTIEVPANVGVGVAAVQDFMANPIGGIARRGFNYGQSFAPIKITQGNLSRTMENYKKNAMMTAKTGLRGRLARKNVIAQQKGAYRKAFNKGKENWNNVTIEQPEGEIVPKFKLSSGKSVNIEKGESFDSVLKKAGSTTKQKQSVSKVKVARSKQEKPLFTSSGNVKASANVSKQDKKKKVANVAAKRAASKGTKELAKLFGASIR